MKHSLLLFLTMTSLVSAPDVFATQSYRSTYRGRKINLLAPADWPITECTLTLEYNREGGHFQTYVEYPGYGERRVVSGGFSLSDARLKPQVYSNERSGNGHPGVRFFAEYDSRKYLTLKVEVEWSPHVRSRSEIRLRMTPGFRFLSKSAITVLSVEENSDGVWHEDIFECSDFRRE